MSSRNYREGRTQIPLRSPVMIDPLAQGPGWTGSILIYTLLTIANINHIMVSFTDHFNAIFSQKLKLEKFMLL